LGCGAPRRNANSWVLMSIFIVGREYFLFLG
jgi:hypothetical protein